MNKPDEKRTAPERIWILDGADPTWWPTAEVGDVEYVRADLARDVEVDVRGAAEAVYEEMSSLDHDGTWYKENIIPELVSAITKHLGSAEKPALQTELTVSKEHDMKAICGTGCNAGPHQEPLACAYRPNHQGDHSWATLPTFCNGKDVELQKLLAGYFALDPAEEIEEWAAVQKELLNYANGAQANVIRSAEKPACGCAAAVEVMRDKWKKQGHEWWNERGDDRFMLMAQAADEIIAALELLKGKQNAE